MEKKEQRQKQLYGMPRRREKEGRRVKRIFLWDLLSCQRRAKSEKKQQRERDEVWGVISAVIRQSSRAALLLFFRLVAIAVVPVGRLLLRCQVAYGNSKRIAMAFLPCPLAPPYIGVGPADAVCGECSKPTVWNLRIHVKCQLSLESDTCQTRAQWETLATLAKQGKAFLDRLRARWAIFQTSTESQFLSHFFYPSGSDSGNPRARIPDNLPWNEKLFISCCKLVFP